MGVHGIVPFLLKKCPQVIENIPKRFQALEGKTIALDGTLITQRFHFTPDNRPSRHVLGWYQLISELRQHNIKVVCIFDGRYRIEAKRNEVERRRRLRMEAQLRGAWEKSRHERLSTLTKALQSIETLPETQQQEVLDNLQNKPELYPLATGGEQPGTELDTSVYSALEDIPNTASQPRVELIPALIPTLEEPNTTMPKSEQPVIDSPPGATADPKESSLHLELSEATAVDNTSTGLEDLSPEDKRVVSETLAIKQAQSAEVKNVIPATDDQASVTEPQSSQLDPTLPDPSLDSTDHPTIANISDDPANAQDNASLVSKLSDLALSKDPEVLDIVVGESSFVEKQEQAKYDLDVPPGVNDNQYLSKIILGLYDHYTRTSTSDPNGLIQAYSDEPGLENIPGISISRVQLKYTQEESKLWKEIVPTSAEAKIDVARVMEHVKQLASVDLSKEEPENETGPGEQEDEEPAPISERAATLEEQSGHMAASLLRRSSPPSALNYAESRLILAAMGVPCIESTLPYEAEALASSLVINGLADFVGSEDTDVLMYNAPLLRHMTNKLVPLQIIPPSTEAGLGLSRSSFVDVAILMGTDFTRRVKGVGPETALRLMQKHGSIERMLEEETKFRPADVAEYLEEVRVARSIFSSIPPVPLPESIAQGEWNEQAIQETMARFGLERFMEGEQLIPDALSDNYFKDDSNSSGL